MLKKNIFKNKTILVTGGGSVGAQLAKDLLQYNPYSIRIFDNSENILYNLEKEIKDNRIRLLYGDIRDKTRVQMALEGCNIVIHTCALKHIHLCNYNPIETIKTNIGGTINLIECMLASKDLEKSIFVSTDKVTFYTSIYGMSKACGEELFEWLAKVSLRKVSSASIRLPNITWTSGNVFFLWKEFAEKNEALPVTDKKMCRYFLPLKACTAYIIKALQLMDNGYILFIPKATEYRMIDIAKKTFQAEDIKIIGIREGEKLREILISPDELSKADDLGDIWRVKKV